VAEGAPDDILGALPAEVIARTSRPLVWRISSRLQAAGRIAHATASEEHLMEALGVAERDSSGLQSPAGPRSLGGPGSAAGPARSAGA
jgi:hypothetical protein